MNKKELISRAVEHLRKNDVRKRVPAQKTVLHISDDNGNNKDFIIRKTEKGILFNTEDVTNVVEVILSLLEDALRQGESVHLHGFGDFCLNYIEGREVKHPKSSEKIWIDPHFIPKFSPGKNLTLAAKVYTSLREDRDELCSGKETDGE